jgi:putative flippase GtrA
VRDDRFVALGAGAVRAVTGRDLPMGSWLRQFGLYAVVSAVALLVDGALFLGLLATQVQGVVAAVIGYLAGLVIHFGLSTRCVFDGDRTGKTRPRLFGEFAASGLVGLVITAVTVMVALDGFGMGPLPAKALAIGFSFLAVFLLRRQVVFAAKQD